LNKIIPLIVSILILGLIGFSQEAVAATFTAVQSGDWNDPATWGGTVPGNTDDKIIPSFISVTITSFVSHEVGTIDNSGIINLASDFDSLLVIQGGGTLNNFGAITIISAERILVDGAGSTLNNFDTIIINPGNALANSNGGIINNQCGGTINNQGSISGNVAIITEILCIPNLVAPADASTVTEPKPDLVWENDAELRLVEYSPNLERTSNPGVPIELVSLSLVSSEPLNDLSNVSHEWVVSVDLAPAYSPGYPFTSSPANSAIFSFIVDVADPHADILQAIDDAKSMILDSIADAKAMILDSLGLLQEDVDDISETVGDLQGILEEISFIDTETIDLDATLSAGDFKLLMDITPFESVTGHVAMKVPCDKQGDTNLAILTGVAPDVAPIIMDFVAPLSDPGKSCVYHGDIEAGITDIALANTGKNSVKFGPNEEGFSVTITIQGTE